MDRRIELDSGRTVTLPERSQAAQRYEAARWRLPHLQWLAQRRYNGIMGAKEAAINEAISTMIDIRSNKVKGIIFDMEIQPGSPPHDVVR